MSTFDESKHDRDASGKFTEMAGSEQDDLLPQAAPDTGAATPEFLAVYSGPAEHAAEAYAMAVWSVIAEPGDAELGAAIREHGAQEVLIVVRSDTAARGAKELGMDREAFARLAIRSHNWMAASQDAFTRAAEHGIHVRTQAEGGIPPQFADLGDTAPLTLWVQGSDEALDGMKDGVSIVGARAATSYGEHAAMELTGAAVADGRTIVSGAAYGIEGAASRAALTAGGKTVVFQAGGADRPYPAGHSHLIANVAARGGAVVSEVPPGAAPTKWRFMARNRLIAAATGTTLVVEAGVRSGSLYTAGQAERAGRKVAAVPGPITSPASAGTNQLIRDGIATLVASPEDLTALMSRS